MKSEYDNETFFRQYAMMPRSKEGLSAAGEWHQLKPLFPPLREKSFLEMMGIPGMEDEMRRPMMLLVKAVAKK